MIPSGSYEPRDIVYDGPWGMQELRRIRQSFFASLRLVLGIRITLGALQKQYEKVHLEHVFHGLDEEQKRILKSHLFDVRLLQYNKQSLARMLHIDLSKYPPLKSA